MYGEATDRVREKKESGEEGGSSEFVPKRDQVLISAGCPWRNSLLEEENHQGEGRGSLSTTQKEEI